MSSKYNVLKEIVMAEETKQEKVPEKERIYKMVEDGKITVEEARRLWEDVGEGGLGGITGFFVKFVLGALAILGFVGVCGLVFYGLIFYAPANFSFEKLAVIYGLFGVIILALTVISIAGIRLAKTGFWLKKYEKGGPTLEAGSVKEEKNTSQ